MIRESLRQHHNTGVKLGCDSHSVQSRTTLVSWHWGTAKQVFVFMKVNKSSLILPWIPRGPVCSTGLRSLSHAAQLAPFVLPLLLLTASPEQCSALLVAGTCLVETKALAQNFLQNVHAPDLGCRPAVTAPCPWQAQRPCWEAPAAQQALPMSQSRAVPCLEHTIPPCVPGQAMAGAWGCPCTAQQ